MFVEFAPVKKFNSVNVVEKRFEEKKFVVQRFT